MIGPTPAAFQLNLPLAGRTDASCCLFELLCTHLTTFILSVTHLLTTLLSTKQCFEYKHASFAQIIYLYTPVHKCKPCCKQAEPAL